MKDTFLFYTPDANSAIARELQNISSLLKGCDCCAEHFESAASAKLATPIEATEPDESAASDKLAAPAEPADEDLNSPPELRLGLFIDASTKALCHEAARQIATTLDKLEGNIVYSFAVAYGKYAKWYLKFFEALESAYGISTAYQKVYTQENKTDIIKEIKDEKYEIIFGKVFARAKAKKFIRKLH